MNRGFFIIIFLFLLAGCRNNSVKEGKKEQNCTDTTFLLNKTHYTIVESQKDSYICIGTEDLGVVHEGETVEISLPIKNGTLNDITITNTTLSCGCLMAQNQIKELKKGEIKELKLLFFSNDKKGDDLVDVVFECDSSLYSIEVKSFVK